MQREAAKKLIKDTFERPFDKEQFTRFVKNLLNHVEDAHFVYRGNLIFDDFKDRVQSLERIGKYQDAEGNKIDVLIVQLLRDTSLERARTAQRTFVAKYLKGSRGGELKDAALVAFVSPDEQDWRFSFVKMDYKIKTTDKRRIKVEEDFTPARRYSFLVGTNENSHTAQSRLLPILEDTDRNPTLAEIEESFSVEKVTKEFYEQYRKLFDDIAEALDTLVKRDKNIRENFEAKGVDTVNFTKKLLGQIVFLYFLQKKGWFGVARNSAWGTGPRGFLRQLFDKKLSDYDNYFNDILEPLFYEALANEREADYYSKFKCKIPFLNGGLFDPLNNYDWVETDILLPNELFSNSVRTKQGDIGTGVLDVFDRYNFTVKEDEPLEKEVAVDPEMLGKVFENLLEVKDRKSKGTYYTPREIVHYMCQESLINYLTMALGGKVSRVDVETLVKHGEAAIENDTRVMESGRETKDYWFKLPEAIRENAKLIDDRLADIKVCDPAVGSGAFLVGMMTEIIRSRQALTLSLSNPQRRTAYDLKRDAIQNSLHGVDIDLGAVEIAKLRLWLSLIVDEIDYKQIQPLPNLDYKIMQGNSLLEEYEGIKLIDEKLFEKQEEKEVVRSRFEKEQLKLQREYIKLDSDGRLTKIRKAEFDKQLREIDKALKELEKPRSHNQDELNLYGEPGLRSKATTLHCLHEQFFSAYNKRQKDSLNKQIDALTWDLIEATLRQQGKSEKLEEVRRFQQTNTRPFFLWRLNYSDVFSNKYGFDIVIANPPYKILTKSNTESKELAAFMNYYTSIRGSYSKNLFTLFIERGVRITRPGGTLSFIVPEGLFKTRSYRNCAQLLGESGSVITMTTFVGPVFENAVTGNLVFVFTKGISADTARFQFDEDYNLHALDAGVDSVLERIQSLNTIPLRDVATLFKGMVVKDRESVIESLEHEGYDVFLLGKSISKWRVKREFYTRYDSLQIIGGTKRIEKYNIFPRILIRRTGATLCCTLLKQPALTESTLYSCYSIGSETSNEFLLGLLNSRLMSYFITRKMITNEQAFPQILMTDLGDLPIVKTNMNSQQTIASLVRKILNVMEQQQEPDDLKRQSLVKALEEEIDQLIYEVYCLTPEEIEIVENSAAK